MNRIHSIISNDQTAIAPAPPDTLSLTQADLDRGLSPDQLSWLFDNLNVRQFLKDLAKIAPADDTPPEPESDGDHGG